MSATLKTFASPVKHAKEDYKFPCLLKFKSNEHYIILATGIVDGRYTGTVIHNEAGFGAHVGFTSDLFEKDNFELSSRTVTLVNK